MLKAVLFDMDGVIVDTEPLHRKAYFNMFNDVNINVSEAMYTGFTGQATLPICKQLVNHFQLPEAPETLVAYKRKHFKHLFDTDNTLQLLDGVLDLIQDYYANGLTLVLASSASMPNINRIFKRFDLDRYFVAKLSGADLKQSKPHPEIFIKAAEAAAQPREHCMVIEDSSNGIQAANDAGIFVVGYDSKHSTDQDYTNANLVVSSFEKIRYEHVKSYF